MQKNRFASCLPVLAVLLALNTASAQAQNARLITSAIDENKMVTVARSVHPSAATGKDLGAAPDDLPMERMLLVLKRSAAQQAALDEFLVELQQPSSPNYHHFLTPEEFGLRFGASEADLQTITDWLQLNGFRVNEVAPGRGVIEFSGTAGQVKNSFRAEIHKFQVNGREQVANATPQQIPAALAGAVAGVATLHNFPRKGQSWMTSERIPVSNPQFTSSSGNHALAPADFATIYNVQPLYPTITGAGVIVAVVGRSNINVSDVNTFRTLTGLAANPPNIIVNGTDPTDLGGGEEAEAVLDTTWAGAIATGATVDLVVSASTNTTDGADLSEQYIINHNLGAVMTESFSACEASVSASDAALISNTAQQAAALGITYMVSAGDAGSADCEDFNTETSATGPVSVNVLASSPYTVAVGGTQFNEGSGTYWASSNGAAQNSALSYIPEDVWNANCSGGSCGTGSILSGGGGKSQYFSKPSWQSGVAGIPADGARDLPDVAFTAAGHDPYLLCLAGSCSGSSASFVGIYGTSASAPSFASIVALIDQKAGARQGQITPRLYALAAAETLANCNGSNTAGLPASNCIFNDITVGTNAVPGETNYNTASETYLAGTGYDLASGLGSTNVANLVNNWTAVITAPAAGVSPNALTFSSQNVGSSGAAQTVTLSNTGNGALSIASVAITGTNAADFSETNTCGSSLAASASCTVSVTFTPSAAGSRSATLVVTDNSGNTSGSTQSVALSGTGSSSAGQPTTFITYLGTYGSGLLSYNGGSAVIPTRAYNPGGTAQIFTLTTNFNNSGSGATEYRVVLHNLGSGNYWLQLSDGPYQNVSPLALLTATGSTITLSSPLAVGSMQVTAYRLALVGNELQLDLSVTRTDTFNDQINLQATTTAPAYSSPWGSYEGTWTSTSTTAPGVTLSASALNFGSVTTGSSATQSVTVTNSGTAALSLSSAQISGTNSSDFLVTTNTCTTSISPNGTCSITVTFTPAAAGARSASLSISDNASGSPQTVALTGTGTTAAQPTTFITYLGTYGSGLLSYNGGSAVIPTRAYNPGGAAQVYTLTTNFNNSVSGATEYRVVLHNLGSGNYWLQLSDGPYQNISPLSLLTATGSTVTLSTPLAIGTMQVTAYRLALAGNELQLDLSVTRSDSFNDQINLQATTTAPAYSSPWGSYEGTWNSTSSSAPGVTLSASALNYGSVTTGSSATQSVTVTNSGTAALSLSSAQISGTNSSDFLVTTNTCTTSISPNGTCSITVTFTPAAAGTRSASLSISDNASGSPQTVTLTGTGTTAAQPTTFITYLGTYGSGLLSYNGGSAVIPTRAYNPGGAAQVYTLTTNFNNSVSGATEYRVVLHNLGSGNYWLQLSDGPYQNISPLSLLTATGSTVTLSTPLAIGTMQVTAYRLALVGNEVQLDLSVTRSDSFNDQINLQATTTAPAYSSPWGSYEGTWTKP